MTIQNILLIALACLSAILGVLLVTRIRKDRSRISAIRFMRLEEFSEFLKSNSVGGSIVEVARKVSSLLTTAFGCDRIVFLRKKRGLMDLNYYHGLRGFRRGDFRMRYSNELAQLLRSDFLPRNLADIKRFLPERLYSKLQHFGIDVFFPIFWRENLYGIYFIRSNYEIQSPSFALLVASLAQSLSAAYHIKWHESKIDSLQKQLDDSRRVPGAVEDASPEVSRFLKLVRHRNTETIVPRLMDSFRDAAGVKRLAYVYGPRNADGEPTSLKHGITGSLESADNEVLREIMGAVENKAYLRVDQLKTEKATVRRYLRGLKEQGLEYVASFPLTSQRDGILAWSGGEAAGAVEKQLQLFKTHAFHLVENAESFEKIEEMSYTDNLTGLANQRYFFRRLHEEINRAKRYNRSLALIIFDMDELKFINDTYGHLAGDAVLKQMGEILKGSSRAIDVVARYGGDEFCVIMPETDAKMCLKFMERLQHQIINSRFTVESVDQPLRCTVSIGGAVYPDHADDSKKLIFAADMALLRAKETGRNRSLLYVRST